MNELEREMGMAHGAQGLADFHGLALRPGSCLGHACEGCDECESLILGDGDGARDVACELHHLETQVSRLMADLAATLALMERLPEQLTDADDWDAADRAARLLHRAGCALRLARLGDDY